MEYTLDAALEILERTPQVIRSFLQGLSDDWIYHNEGPETWSPFDVVGHLIHGEKTDWTERLKIVLSEGDRKTFAPFDRFAQFEDSKDKTLNDLLLEFEQLRANNLTFLKALNLSETDYGKTGVHPALGEVTLKELLSTWVVHDLGHIVQISRVMAKQYKDEVGPWQEYLTVLH